MLVFEEKVKPKYPEKNLSEQRREPTTKDSYMFSVKCRPVTPPWKRLYVTIIHRSGGE